MMGEPGGSPAGRSWRTIVRIIHRLSPAALATAGTPPPSAAPAAPPATVQASAHVGQAARHHAPEKAGAAQGKPKPVALRRLATQLRAFMRAVEAASVARPGDPELAENDYYRLRNHPRD
jgi:hypothetical protein